MTIHFTRRFAAKVSAATIALGDSIQSLRQLTGADELRAEVGGVEYVVRRA